RKLADESILLCIRNGPSRLFASRSESPIRRATSNIDVAFHRLRELSPAFARSSSMLSAFCVMDRLPDDSVTIVRSPSLAITRILEKRAIWSTPALVRESDAKIIPASRHMATQYVIG